MAFRRRIGTGKTSLALAIAAELGAEVPAIETGFERAGTEHNLDFYLQRYGQTRSAIP